MYCLQVPDRSLEGAFVLSLQAGSGFERTSFGLLGKYVGQRLKRHRWKLVVSRLGYCT